MERVLLTKESKMFLCNYLKKSNNASSLMALSTKLRTPVSTLETWFYNQKRYLPKSVIPTQLLYQLTILDVQKENWGKSIGGKKAHKTNIQKYGQGYFRKRQVEGGKKRAKLLDEERKKTLSIDFKNPRMLELYGALLGDGWLSANKYQTRTQWWIGLCGHAKKDKQYLNYMKTNIEYLLNRKVTSKTRNNCTQLIVCHKHFVKFMNTKMGFPIGKKKNLKISEEAVEWPEIKHVIRGIFDADGSLYFDKSPNGNHYPIISIHMKAPELLNQIYKVLIRRGFKIRFRENEIILKGKKQLDKWLSEIGSSNPKHFLKVQKINRKHVPVAQHG